MKPRIEVVAIDCLMVRLFDVIAEDNMPWMLAATRRLREGFGPALVDLVPSYTTLMVHYDLMALSPAQARELIDQALKALQPEPKGSGQCHVLPVWYDLSVGPELPLLAQRSGLAVEEVIRRHSQHEYQVFALGFVPGFAFGARLCALTWLIAGRKMSAQSSAHFISSANFTMAGPSNLDLAQ